MSPEAEAAKKEYEAAWALVQEYQRQVDVHVANQSWDNSQIASQRRDAAIADADLKRKVYNRLADADKQQADEFHPPVPLPAPATYTDNKPPLTVQQPSVAAPAVNPMVIIAAVLALIVIRR
jgi:hypothetical protein